MYKQHKQLVQKNFLLVVMLLISLTAVAADSSVKDAPDYSLFPEVRFQFDLNKPHKNTSYLSNLGGDLYSTEFDGMPEKGLSTRETTLNQYDTTFYYPFARKGMSFDLGLNMKYIDGQTHSLENGQYRVHNFRAALPMVSASALFDLPFKGLSAGFEGKHYLELDNEQNKGFDYKAKLNYEMDKSFGLQGGWQHQQFSLDNASETPTEFEKKGPFLDLYLRF